MFVGVDDDLDPVAEAELGEGARDVALDGGFAEEQVLAISALDALGELAYDLEFSFGEGQWVGRLRPAVGAGCSSRRSGGG